MSSRLTQHDYAVLALCLGVVHVADAYQFALMLGDARRRSRRRVRAGVPAGYLMAGFSAAGRRS